MLNAFWPCKFVIPAVEKRSWVLFLPSDLKWPRCAACKQAISAAAEVPHPVWQHRCFDYAYGTWMWLKGFVGCGILLATSTPRCGCKPSASHQSHRSEADSAASAHQLQPTISLPALPGYFSADLFPFAFLSKAANYELTVTKEEKDAARARAQN